MRLNETSAATSISTVCNLIGSLYVHCFLGRPQLQTKRYWHQQATNFIAEAKWQQALGTISLYHVYSSLRQASPQEGVVAKATKITFWCQRGPPCPWYALRVGLGAAGDGVRLIAALFSHSYGQPNN